MQQLVDSKAKRLTYSQHQEEIIISDIFQVIGTTNRFCVEFGAGDGRNLSNTRALIDQGWSHLLMDCQPTDNPDVKLEQVTAENINLLFAKYGVPKQPDLVSIDVDGNDYWIWKALESQPRVVCIEFNPQCEKTAVQAIEYNPNHQWNGTDDYHGASFEALIRLGNVKGYAPLENTACNLIFVLTEFAPSFHLPVPNYPTYEPKQIWPHNPDGKWVQV